MKIFMKVLCFSVVLSLLSACIPSYNNLREHTDVPYSMPNAYVNNHFTAVPSYTLYLVDSVVTIIPAAILGNWIGYDSDMHDEVDEERDKRKAEAPYEHYQGDKPSAAEQEARNKYSNHKMKVIIATWQYFTSTMTVVTASPFVGVKWLFWDTWH